MVLATKVVRVLIIDGQEYFSEGLRLLLSRDPTLEVMQTPGSSIDALQTLREQQPDVVVMEARLPGQSGIEIARQIREEFPEMGIIIHSYWGDSEYIQEFLKDDPRGKAYILKQTMGTTAELIRIIHEVADGKTVLDPIMVERLTGKKDLGKSPLRLLTRREIEVLALMAKARTNSEIAGILYIQPRTVEHHINSIFGKLGILQDEGLHARVKSVLMYLIGIGQLESVVETP